MANAMCPCGSGRAYAACCERWHAGTPAPDAESLMRSRYSAFVLHNQPYLLTSWHPDTRPSGVTFEPNLKWLGLKVVAARQIDESHAELEFIARFRVGGGSAARLHELSRFVREDGRWLYLDGQLRDSK